VLITCARVHWVVDLHSDHHFGGGAVHAAAHSADDDSSPRHHGRTAGSDGDKPRQNPCVQAISGNQRQSVMETSPARIPAYRPSVAIRGNQRHSPLHMATTSHRQSEALRGTQRHSPLHMATTSHE
jgi:hypothetical protein